MRGIWSFSLRRKRSIKPVNLLVYSSREESGEPVFGIRFGVLPQIYGDSGGSDMVDAHVFSGNLSGAVENCVSGQTGDRRKSAGLCWRRFLGG